MKSVKECGVIARVYEESLAEELGLEPGDKILQINGQALKDIIDLSFAFADEEIELLIERANGEQECIEFDKDYDEELGVEFESAVFDGMRRCGNRCWFCFVDQIAPGMRPSLSVKDDDYRMSFLYGNFVTLTNLRDEDYKRIERLHLSPLFISVHTTDGELRARMLHNKRAAGILPQMKRLIGSGNELHTQIVLCPGINDGAALQKTIEELMELQPAVLSLAIVPVGLTKFRDGCYPLRKFSPAEAGAVIDIVEEYQKKNRDRIGTGFVYLGDEFYFLAGRTLPPAEAYDGFPQLENGIGLTRNFLNEWNEGVFPKTELMGYESPLYLDLVCGKSARDILEKCVSDLQLENLHVRVVAVENAFFGEDITVTGLLTGKDILEALKRLDSARDGIIIPGVALRSGEAVFLDDCELPELASELKTQIEVCHTGAQLKELLVNWPEHDRTKKRAKEKYTWQSNCGYSKNK